MVKTKRNGGKTQAKNYNYLRPAYCRYRKQMQLACGILRKDLRQAETKFNSSMQVIQERFEQAKEKLTSGKA